MSVSKAPPIHPGEILWDLYLDPLEITPYALAKLLNVPRTRIERLVAEKTGITSDTALRLSKFFKTSPEYWMNLQSAFDLKTRAALLETELAAIPEIDVAA